MTKWTVQGLIDAGMTLTAYCQIASCSHSQRLDLARLREKLGPDAPAMHDDLAPKMRCSECLGKQVGLIYSPRSNDERQAQPPRPNLYAKARDG